jgi:hypothetical protein
MRNTHLNQLTLYAGLTAKTVQRCLCPESDATNIQKLVTPATVELPSHQHAS